MSDSAPEKKLHAYETRTSISALKHFAAKLAEHNIGKDYPVRVLVSEEGMIEMAATNRVCGIAVASIRAYVTRSAA